MLKFKHFYIFIFFYVLSVSIHAQTQVNLYTPFGDKAEQTTVTIQQHLEGSCLAQSSISSRSDAWQCKVKDQIYDPCFVKTYIKRDEVICPLSPWNTFAIKIHLSKPLAVSNKDSLDMMTQLPWALELVDGTKCQYLSSFMGEIEGKRINYMCQPQGQVVGKIQKCEPLWHVLVQEKNAPALQRMAVKKAWY